MKDETGRILLAPRNDRRAWTPEEDARVATLVEEHGTRCWALVGSKIPTRTGKQCRERWHNHLSPDVKNAVWTPQEDMIIIRLHKLHGSQWTDIAKNLPGRTDNAVKNRWNSAIRRVQRQQKRFHLYPSTTRDPLYDYCAEFLANNGGQSGDRRGGRHAYNVPYTGCLTCGGMRNMMNPADFCALDCCMHGGQHRSPPCCLSAEPCTSCYAPALHAPYQYSYPPSSIMPPYIPQCDITQCESTAPSFVRPFPDLPSTLAPPPYEQTLGTSSSENGSETEASDEEGSATNISPPALIEKDINIIEFEYVNGNGNSGNETGTQLMKSSTNSMLDLIAVAAGVSNTMPPARKRIIMNSDGTSKKMKGI